MNVAVRAAMALSQFVAGGPRLSCLIYHRVVAAGDPLFPDQVTAEIFEWQMAALAAEFRVMPLSEAIIRLARGDLPPRAACVTFDDGYADNHDVALPILLKHRIPACFFVATGFLDGGCMWNDSIIEAVRSAPDSVLQLTHLGLGRLALDSAQARRRAIDTILVAFKHRPLEERESAVAEVQSICGTVSRSDLMMSSDQVRALARSGMEIGAHTVNHPILASLDANAARLEILEGKQRLEELIGGPVSLFAYPNGRPHMDYTAEHVAMVRGAGFKGAVTTAWGSAGAEKVDLYQIPRFTPWDATKSGFLLRLAGNTFSRNYNKT